MSKIDIIIPCYNYGCFLSQCVESVLGQEGPELRVLILDDASRDETPVVGAGLAASDGRVTFRRHTSNRGHIATYNEGLDWVDADYVLLLSADDLLTPGALARAALVMDEHPEVGLVFGRHVDFRTGQSLPTDISADPRCGSRVFDYGEFLEASCGIGHTPIESPTAVVRAGVHRLAGGYRPELPHSGDTELWLRLAALASVVELDADQAFRRWHGGNMTHDRSPVGRLRQQEAAFEAHFRDHVDRLGDLGPYRRRVARALAQSAFWAGYFAFEQGDGLTCRDCLAYAADRDPAIRGRPEWSRLRWKRLIGASAWSALRPLVDAIRRPAAHPEAPLKSPEGIRRPVGVSDP